MEPEPLILQEEPFLLIIWDNGEITQTVSNLGAGTHLVEVTDANGCVETTSVTIGQPATAVTLTVAQSFNGCNGENDNEATAVGAGGTGPGYTYLWSNAQQGATAINLSPGTLSVTVTDQNGCTAEGNVDLTDLELLYGDIIISEPTCHGYPDGSLGVNNFGGGAGQDGEEADYNFTWSNGDNGVVADNVLGGATYYVTIEDANGCSTVVSRFLSDPILLNLPYWGKMLIVTRPVTEVHLFLILSETRAMYPFCGIHWQEASRPSWPVIYPAAPTALPLRMKMVVRRTVL